jgi:hypothetical protein
LTFADNPGVNVFSMFLLLLLTDHTCMKTHTHPLPRIHIFIYSAARTTLCPQGYFRIFQNSVSMYKELPHFDILSRICCTIFSYVLLRGYLCVIKLRTYFKTIPVPINGSLIFNQSLQAFIRMFVVLFR